MLRTNPCINKPWAAVSHKTAINMTANVEFAIIMRMVMQDLPTHLSSTLVSIDIL